MGIEGRNRPLEVVLELAALRFFGKGFQSYCKCNVSSLKNPFNAMVLIICWVFPLRSAVCCLTKTYLVVLPVALMSMPIRIS